MQAERRETILLVEDDLPVRVLTTTILERAGYHVVTAGTTNEAIYQSGTFRGLIHMVITDVMMPGGTGMELAVKLLAGGLRAPVLFMSGYEAGLFVRQGTLTESCPFLQKPFTRLELLAKVRELIDSANTAGREKALEDQVLAACAS